MALLILSGDIENAHPIDGSGIERLASNCHSIKRISGHEGQAVWECKHMFNGKESRFHILTTSRSFAHESIAHYERKLRDQQRQERIRSEAGMWNEVAI